MLGFASRISPPNNPSLPTRHGRTHPRRNEKALPSPKPQCDWPKPLSAWICFKRFGRAICKNWQLYTQLCTSSRNLAAGNDIYYFNLVQKVCNKHESSFQLQPGLKALENWTQKSTRRCGGCQNLRASCNCTKEQHDSHPYIIIYQCVYIILYIYIYNMYTKFMYSLPLCNIYIYVYITVYIYIYTPGRESQCICGTKVKTAWDAAHSGSQTSQCNQV